MKTIISNGLGVDSAALISRLAEKPGGINLREVICLTADTGNEYDATWHAATALLFPTALRAGMRVVVAARAGQSDTAGITTLYDSARDGAYPGRRPGPWRLSDELDAAGILPPTGGGRRCSQRAKGFVLDRWIAAETGGEPFTHVVGFAQEEDARVAGDRVYRTNGREPRYLLREWGWDRQACLTYIHDIYGIQWPRSCCTFCPFQSGKDAANLAARWRAQPSAAVDAIVREHLVLVLNPRQALFKDRTARQVALSFGLVDAIAEADRRIEARPWALYDVRRVFTAAIDKGSGRPDPWRKGPAWRAVAAIETGTAQQVRRLAIEEHGAAPDRHGILRAVTLRPEPPYPCPERCLVAGPAGVVKQRPGFERLWDRVLAEHVPEPALF